METQDIEKLLKKSEDELLLDWFSAEMLAEVGGDFQDLASSPADMKKLFKKWSGDHLAEIVCIEWAYCQKRKTYGKTIELVTQLGEFIYSSIKTPFPVPFSLAVLIVMHGFDQFCDCMESE